MNFNFYHRFNEIPNGDWERLSINDKLFLSKNFLQSFENQMDNDFSGIYVIAKIESRVVGILYAQIFKLNSKKIKEYIRNSNPQMTLLGRIKLVLAELLSLRVCFLGNLFMSNESTYYFVEEFSSNNLTQLLREISDFSNSKLVMIPEFFNYLIPQKSTNFLPLYVEPDMHMHIPEDWIYFDDYVSAIQSKYKKKLRKVLINSSSLNIKELDVDDLIIYESQISTLFNNVFYKSSFNASKFETKIFSHLKKNGLNISVKGYFIENKMVGFSSSIIHKNQLYVYFMGLDYTLNKVHDIYSRMLYDNIKYAINQRFSVIKFGRTASEFKSNFGAKPIGNRAFIYSKSIFFKLLGPFTQLIKPKIWRQRNPYK